MMNLKTIFKSGLLLLSIFSCSVMATESQSSILSSKDLKENTKQEFNLEVDNSVFNYSPFHNLKLTELQKKSILNIINQIGGTEHFQKQSELRNQLNSFIFNDNFLEKKEVNDLLNALANDYREFLISEITLENKIYSLLNGQQKETYIKNIKELTNLLSQTTNKATEKKDENIEFSKEDIKKLIFNK